VNLRGNLRRGTIWKLEGYPLSVLVISGNMYNDQALPNSVLAMPVTDRERWDTWTAPLGDGEFAVVDGIMPYLKQDFRTARRQVDIRALAEVDNLLFKILATN
jgi:hypothetical protein